MATSTDPAKHYNSNPFTLAFDALGRLFQTNVGWVIVLVIVGFFVFLGNTVSGLIDLTANSTQQPTSSEFSFEPDASIPRGTELGIIILILAIVFFLGLSILSIGFVFETYLVGMFTYVALQSEKGKSVSFSEAFNAVGSRFWRLLWARGLAVLKILGWTLLFIVPGIVASLRYSLLPYLIMDESETEKGIGDSHAKTKVMVKGRLMEVFGVGFVATIVPFVGSVLGIAGRGALYRQLHYSQSHEQERPPVHWLNYLGLLLLGLVIIFGVLLVLIIAIAASEL